jgi:hypothetical protein
VESGAGYPPHRKESQQASRQTLMSVSTTTHRSMAEIIDALPDDIVKPTLDYPGVRELINVDAVEDEAMKIALLKYM